MEKETQFKINSKADLIQAYNHFEEEWDKDYSLKDEITDFNEDKKYRYIQKDDIGIIYLYEYDKSYKSVPNPLKEHWLVQLANDTNPNKYAVSIRGVELDVYDILDAHNVRNPALQHLIKKCLHGGMRGHKSREQDLKDIISSAKRAYEIEFKND